jgi:hypothetical protein
MSSIPEADPVEVAARYDHLGPSIHCFGRLADLPIEPHCLMLSLEGRRPPRRHPR